MTPSLVARYHIARVFSSIPFQSTCECTASRSLARSLALDFFALRRLKPPSLPLASLARAPWARGILNPPRMPRRRVRAAAPRTNAPARPRHRARIRRVRFRKSTEGTSGCTTCTTRRSMTRRLHLRLRLRPRRRLRVKHPNARRGSDSAPARWIRETTCRRNRTNARRRANGRNSALSASEAPSRRADRTAVRGPTRRRRCSITRS